MSDLDEIQDALLSVVNSLSIIEMNTGSTSEYLGSDILPLLKDLSERVSKIEEQLSQK